MNDADVDGGAPDAGVELESVDETTWVDDEGVRYRRTMTEDGPKDEPIGIDAEVYLDGETA